MADFETVELVNSVTRSVLHFMIHLYVRLEMKSKLLYVELKSGYSDDGPAWIGRGTYSKSGRTIYFNGQAFQSMKGAGIGANYYDLETLEEYWISGVKKNENNRHWAGSGIIQIDQDVVEEFKNLTGRKELNKNEFEVIEFSKEDVKSRINEEQNQTMVSTPRWLK